MAELSRFSLHPGDPAPDFALPGVDGRVHALHDYDDRPLLLVVFWCNHCPYVQAWEGRMMELARRFAPQGVAAVLINSNDAVSYPDDGFDHMAERARRQKYPIPYLWDETQAVARAYGALVTPHPMLFDRKRRLIFQGRIDDQYGEPGRVKHRYLEEALTKALAEEQIAEPELPVQGCSIKWRA